jgi:hypothetical protein
MINANVASPISLIQWLDPSDVQRETQDALAAFANEVEIFFADVQTKSEVNEALASWLKNTTNTQYSFIGAHGDETALQPSLTGGKVLRGIRSGIGIAKEPCTVVCGSAHAIPATQLRASRAF